MKQGELVDKSFEFAIAAHKGQYRKDFPLPYATHVIEVYKRLFNYGVRDEEILSAALLHDYIEDVNTETGYEVLVEQFGVRVADVVQECSRTGGDHVGNNHKLDFLKSFSKKSCASVALKIADRVCNVRDYLHADRPIYAAWYALQAYPLYQRYSEDINSKYMRVLNLKYIDEDLRFLSDLIRTRYDVWEGYSKFDNILMKRPRE